MKTRLYLILLVLVIMSAGARTMFRIAYNAMSREQDGGPDKETTALILLAIWFVLMMVCDVLILKNRNLKGRNIMIVILSIGIFAPIIYMLITHKP